VSSPTEPVEPAALEVVDRRSGPDDRRATTRHPFTATVQIVELTAGLRLTARISDLSEGGCFVDTMSPLDSGLRTRLRIRSGEETVEAVGLVRFSQPGMGMGMQFVEIGEASRAILTRWLHPAEEMAAPAFEDAPMETASPRQPRTERELLADLVKLLVRKNILTEFEAAQLVEEVGNQPVPNPF